MIFTYLYLIGYIVSYPIVFVQLAKDFEQIDGFVTFFPLLVCLLWPLGLMALPFVFIFLFFDKYIMVKRNEKVCTKSFKYKLQKFVWGEQK